MFYDGEKIKEDELYETPAGEQMMEWHKDRPEEVKKMEKRLAKKYQEQYKGKNEGNYSMNKAHGRVTRHGPMPAPGKLKKRIDQTLFKHIPCHIEHTI